LKEAIDEVKANGLDTVYQQLTSVITQYRFAYKSQGLVSRCSWSSHE